MVTTRKTIETVCENCNNIFHKALSEFKRSENVGRKHFCSKKCDTEFKKIVLNKCKQCGVETQSKTFCSRKCSVTYNNKQRKGKKRKFSEKGINNIILASKHRLNNNNNFIQYNTNPKHCIECNKALKYGHRKRKFCNVNCKRSYDRKNMSNYQKYYSECKFQFKLSDFPNEFDFRLINKHGWYQAKNHGDNLNGISRDHMVSVKYGYENNISSEIIRHPANCKLMAHNDNASKHINCSITIDVLLNRIKIWNDKYQIL